MNFKQAYIFMMLLIWPVFALACAPTSTPTPAPTQTPAPSSSSGGWTTYNADNGLGGNIVAALVVGPDGAVWAGLRDEDKAGGVSRFAPSALPAVAGQDGEKLTRYTMDDGLPYRMVLSIAAGPNGVMWFGTFGAGVSRFDPSALPSVAGHGGQNWTTYKKEEGLPHNEIRSIAAGSDGAVWLATKRGVSRFDGQNWTTYTTADGLANDNVYAVVMASDGAAWFGTEGGGVSRFDGKNWTTYTTTDGLANDNIRSAILGPDGALWFGTLGGGVSRFDPSAGSGHGGKNWTTYTTADGLASNIVYAIAASPAGALWFGTYGGGVSRFDPSTLPSVAGRSGENWTTFTEKDGLADNDVLAVAVTPDGAVWIGTEDGLSRYMPVSNNY